MRKLRLQIQEKAFHRRPIAMSDRKNAAKVCFEKSALRNIKENNDKNQVKSDNIF